MESWLPPPLTGSPVGIAPLTGGTRNNKALIETRTME